MVVVGRALAPLEALSQAMSGIESGSYGVHIEPGGAPELAAICTKMNRRSDGRRRPRTGAAGSTLAGDERDRVRFLRGPHRARRSTRTRRDLYQNESQIGWSSSAAHWRRWKHSRRR